MTSLYICNKILYVSLLCAILCLQRSIQDKVYLQVLPKELQYLQQVAEVCSKETGIPATHLKTIIDNTEAHDKPNKLFFFCVLHNAEYLDKDGFAIPDKVFTLRNINGTKEELMNNIKECNEYARSVRMNLPNVNYETSTAMDSCMRDKYVFFV